jgi:cytochrome P450
MIGFLKHYLLGDLPRLRAEVLAIFTESARENAVTPLRIGPKRGFLIGDPALVRHVLVENQANYDKRTPAFRSVSVALGNGLLTSNGVFWRRQRRIAQPAFHADKLERLAPIFSRLATECGNRWERAASEGKPVDACAEMMRTTLEGVAECLFGADLSDKAAEIYRLFPNILNELARRVTSGIALPLWIPTQGNRRLRAALREFQGIVHGMIERKRARIRQAGAEGDSSPDLLSVLMSSKDEETGESMSDRQLRDEVMTMLIAGHETTANALSWIWYLLDLHPEEQEMLREEVVRELGGETPTFANIHRLKRLRMVFMEALRLYPPVWMIDRRALGPDRLGETSVSKGDLVIISSYAIHRKPDLWKDPDFFRPERFEPGNEEQPNKFAYLPFGSGPRVCMGMGFAMIESQIILATLLTRFRARLWEQGTILPRPIVTLRPEKPVLLRLEKLNV